MAGLDKMVNKDTSFIDKKKKPKVQIHNILGLKDLT